MADELSTKQLMADPVHSRVRGYTAEDPPVQKAQPVTPPSNEPQVTPSGDENAHAELGDAGKKALQEERQARKDAERQVKDLSARATRADELEQELAALREGAMSDQERAIKQARTEAFEQGRNEVLSEANIRLFTAEVKAASAGKVVDPDLLSDPVVAQKLLKFDDVPFTSDGAVDADAISAAVDSLLEAKPHLAASATRPPGSADQGARPAGTPPLPKSLEDAYAAHYT